MPREFTRSDRVSDAIQRILAQVIRSEIRDPRIGMVNINEVTVTRDMAYAKVYVTFVGVDDEKDSITAASILNKASGFLRTFIARELSMRTVPKLQFIYDKTSVKGQALSTLIERALKEDSLHQHDEEPASDAAPDDTKGE
ncbi:ribosome-binding factor A [Cellvibrio sp. BR]|jgi:ribosome-binding factor A|uniref:30S ribosome-binding factor RbfA n=1 Tax=unclassified Cellvibrio TaxID=2624793 RepID=UPI0002600922|nr:MULTISPECIES: 30S ribosome-binding factor RbfA [unclassified Cellvibrio]EIK43471.1 ribosome-binding factor A [Cellvibrio sp. BR]QEY11968.1 30S ribosome-binding factor RbfA [Cellvibrio sp. KY-YJ-3]